MFTKQVKLSLALVITISIFLTLCPKFTISSNISHADFGRITDGEDATVGEYPMIVSLQFQDFPCNPRDTINAECAGTILNDFTILTAAHCLPKDKKLFRNLAVLVGGVDNKQMHECYWVDEFEIHPDFTDPSTSPNIGMLKVNRPIKFAELGPSIAVKTCLPDEDTHPITSECHILGWGRLEDQTTGNMLKKKVVINIELITQNEEKPDEFWKIPAGGACYGDGGGPLLCLVEDGPEDQWVQFGIGSHGEGHHCYGSSYYTNVALYSDWIKEYADKLVE